MDETVENSNLICKHCKKNIRSLDEVPKHSCFFNKDVFMDEKNMLFTTEVATSDHSSCSIPFNNDKENEFSHNLETRHEDETSAQWTKQSILMLLSLYESNMSMLENPRKKIKIWSAIADGLQNFGINMSTDQIRWKMNALTKRYRECVDNNSKSGRSTLTFEWYDRMEEIFGTYRNASAVQAVSTKLPAKKKLFSKEVTENSTCSNSQSIPASLTSTNLKDAEKSGLPHKRSRPLHGTGSDKAKAKLELEKQWLHHLQAEEKRRAAHEEKLAKMMEKKTEALRLKKRQLEMKEKELEHKKTIAEKKFKCKERRHSEIMEVEKMKCGLLKKLLRGEKNVDFDSNDED